jgi:hypothetical protein
MSNFHHTFIRSTKFKQEVLKQEHANTNQVLVVRTTLTNIMVLKNNYALKARKREYEKHTNSYNMKQNKGTLMTQ